MVKIMYFTQWFVCLCVLPMIILALVVGIVAAGVSGPVSIGHFIISYQTSIIQTIMELSTTLHKYLDDQTVQENWDNMQENVRIIIIEIS